MKPATHDQHHRPGDRRTTAPGTRPVLPAPGDLAAALGQLLAAARAALRPNPPMTDRPTDPARSRGDRPC